jgi:hypothetical protein
MCLSGGTCLPEQRRGMRIMCFAQVDMSLHSDTLSSFHVFAPFARVDMSLHSDTLSSFQAIRMRIMCLSGGTCLPEQREQRRMAWNEDNVSEWRDMST